MVLTGSAFLVKDLTPERHRMTRIAGIIGGLAFGAVCLLAGILLTIEAVQASGSGRVRFAIGAVFLYLFAALMAFRRNAIRLDGPRPPVHGATRASTA